MTRILLPGTAALLLLGGVGGPAASAQDPPRLTVFERRVVPILRTNCYGCHGAVKNSGLDLRAWSTLKTGGRRGAAVLAGKAAQSLLYQAVARKGELQMPPGKRLTDLQIETIRAWIDSGAPHGADERLEDARPWAFRPVSRHAVPEVRQTVWVRNPIDAFVLARLEANGLRPAAPAEKHALIRRAMLDLLGLPPTPEEVDAFVRDTRKDAYEHLIDRLLNSPHYGERWARHWLDLARYAESEGFKSDELRPNAWRYRDYVIRALNSDRPYDRFIKEQIAGDEIYPDDPDALVATGFCRHFPDESNARDLRQRRQEILNDITDTTGASVLGLTLGCARCHDHKYDPIPQRDYYRLQAFFAAVQPRDDLILLSGEARSTYQKRLKEWEEKTRAVRDRLEALEAPHVLRLMRGHLRKFPEDVQQAVDTPPARRTALQWLLARKVEPQIVVSSTELAKAIKPDEKEEWTRLHALLEQVEPARPPSPPIGIGITDIGAVAPGTYRLAAGVFDRPLEEVEPGFLSVCTTASPGIAQIRTGKGADWNASGGQISASTGRRSALARWIASPDNPLTARVMVNRLWQHHFGQGIVATPSDFGAQGERPSSPELLDWLAGAFVRSGWSLKAMHRMIMTSSTYRQSATWNAAGARKDPENRLLWRFRRQRLEGEVIRDLALSVSGLLNPRAGGPAVVPPLPDGVPPPVGWKVTADPAEQNRRSIYMLVKRNLRFPLFEVFDMPDTHEPCGRRQVTTTAPQALTLLNDAFLLRAGSAFAARVTREAGSDPDACIDRAYRLAFGRTPSAGELRAARAFLVRQAQIAGPPRRSAGLSPLEVSSGPELSVALVDFCHALLNSSEFLYVE